MTLEEWAGETNINYDTLRCRLKKGWTFERSITEPDHAKSPTPKVLADKTKKLITRRAQIDETVKTLLT